MVKRVGTLSVEFLEQPDGVVGDFISFLAADFNYSVGLYRRKDMEQLANKFHESGELTDENLQQVHKWIESLPWHESGYLALVIRW